MVSNSQIAKDKKWDVLYAADSTIISATTGGHVCDIGTDMLVYGEEMHALYPNPVRDVLHISAAAKIERIEIYDLLGNKLLEVGNTASVKIGYLPSGVYCVRVSTSQGETTHRIVKE